MQHQVQHKPCPVLFSVFDRPCLHAITGDIILTSDAELIALAPLLDHLTVLAFWLRVVRCVACCGYCHTADTTYCELALLAFWLLWVALLLLVCALGCSQYIIMQHIAPICSSLPGHLRLD